MKVYIVIARREIELVTTNKEKAEALKKEWQTFINQGCTYDTVYIVEREVED